MYQEMVYYNRMHVKTRPKTKLVPIFIVKDCILAQTVRLCKSALRKRFIHVSVNEGGELFDQM